MRHKLICNCIPLIMNLEDTNLYLKFLSKFRGDYSSLNGIGKATPLYVIAKFIDLPKLCSNIIKILLSLLLILVLIDLIMRKLVRDLYI